MNDNQNASVRQVEPLALGLRGRTLTVLGKLAGVSKGWILLALLPFTLLFGITGCATPTAKANKIPPAKVERVAATNRNRVILTESGAQRIGIRTVEVREEPVIRKRKYGGEVMEFPAGSNAAAAPGKAVVSVSLNESDLNKVRRVEPALILPLTGDPAAAGWPARPIKPPAGLSPEETNGVLYYELDNSNARLVPGQRVFLELVLAGSGAVRKIIPFAAVLYDTHGETWTYANAENLVFVREPITIDYFEGDQAFLFEGPPAGTKVLATGAAEMYGIEFGVGK